MAKRTVTQILHAAEAEVADLATMAAKERQYERAERLLGLARQLAASATRFDESPPAPTAKDQSHSVPAFEVGANVSVEDGDDDAPVFERNGDELVKTGKSKEGKVYEHKAPRPTIDCLLRAIADKSTKHGEFRTSRIFPLVDSEGRKLPVYQGYLCLRWLRQIGLVNRVARQRYQLAQGLDPHANVESAWQSLHQRGA